MNSPLIRMRSIYKEYHIDRLSVQALRGIDLDVHRGEFIAILGPSGSGKSTLMNIMGCLDIPDSGEYQVNGNDVTRMDDNALTHTRNRTLGFVFQNFNLLPRRTALENVETPLIYAGMRKKERLDRSRAMLAKVGLADRGHHVSSQLSGGQQQRVAIARALINKPEILLADEPTGNLDSAASEGIMNLLTKTNNTTALTIVLITHDTKVANCAHRRLYLHDGQLRDHP